MQNFGIVYICGSIYYEYVGGGGIGSRISGFKPRSCTVSD